MLPCLENIFRNKALLCRIAVRAIVLDAVRNIQIVIHLAQHSDKICDLLILCLSAELHIVSDVSVALSCSRILCVEGDDLREVHGICGTVDDMSAVISENSTCLMSHRMYDSEKSARKCNSRKAL